MARPRKYVIKLTENEYKKLKSIIRKKATSKTIRCRCQIILDLDESHGKVLTHEQSAKSNGVCLATVTNTVTKYINGGVNAVTEFKRSINSDNARRKVDGRVEARLIAVSYTHLDVYKRQILYWDRHSSRPDVTETGSFPCTVQCSGTRNGCCWMGSRFLLYR